MTRRLVARQTVRASPGAVFEFLADHRHVVSVLEGVTRWEPIGGRSRGVGARFEVEMRTLGFALSGVLVLDLWDPPHGIGWRSESGLIAQRGRWTLRPLEGVTEVELEIGYRPPGGRVGGLMAGGVEGLVRQRLKRALITLGRRLEEPG